ncbi:MAG TPA: hypothetical protein VGL61_25745 [Kofleriaceae bacterium]
MKDRTAQDLLAERRQDALEAARESDAIARELLEYHIAEIDRELAARRKP